MKKYNYFDTHCDTLTKIYADNLTLDSNGCMVNTGNISVYGGYAQFFAVFNNGTLNEEDMVKHFRYLKKQCDASEGVISFARTTDDIDANIICGKASALLSVEGAGNQPDFDIACIHKYADYGVRMMSICWNNDNALCGGIENNRSGLTVLGKKVVAAMEKHKIILDVSHMSDKSFSDVSELWKLPIVASHSNSRTITPNMRNITDEQFDAIVKSGGVCGINFYPPFMGNDGITSAIRHIEHFMSLGGENNICIGSDFDGINITADGLEDSSCVTKLFDGLLHLNYKDSTISKIAFVNFYNLLTKFEI